MKASFRKLIVAALAVTMTVLTFAACSDVKEEIEVPAKTNTEAETEDSAPADAAAEDEQTAPEASEYPGDNCNLAYTDVLKAHEQGIRTYWGSENGDMSDPDPENSKTRAVAITDINGDDIPELMFMHRNNEYEAELKVFTFDPVRKTAYPYEYSCAGENEEPAPFQDLRVDGGRSIMLYKGAEKNVVYMLYEQSSGTFTASAAKFTCGEKGMTREWDVKNSYDPAPDNENSTYDFYWINGEETSSEKGSELFKRANEDYGKLIMFSGNSAAISAFRHTETDEPLAMTYDQAVTWLSEQ